MPSPEHEALVEMVLSAPPGEGTIEESRAGYDAMLTANPLPDDARIEEINIEHMNADWVSVPESDDSRAVLYLHGGGYVIGSNVGYREMAAKTARATGARVLLINYRLAPENPFPAAVDDAVMAYRYLLAQGIPAERIVVAGDSAGGGLAIATLVALRDAGEPLPSCAVAFSPWVDLEGTGESNQPGVVDDPMVSMDALKDMAGNYAGADLRNPLASPLHANLDGLPPLQVFVGTREILRDDAIRIVDNARSAGVEASINVGQELIHVWQLFDLPEARESLSQVSEFVAKHIAG